MRVSIFQPLANRAAPSPRQVPEYDVEYEDYSTKYASPLKKGQARLGYRSISPMKHQQQASPNSDYDTTDFRPGTDQSPGYYDKMAGGRPDVRDGAEAGEPQTASAAEFPIKSRLNFSAEESDESPDVRSYRKLDNGSGKEYRTTPTGPSAANESSNNWLSSKTPPHYDPKQYQDMSLKVGLPLSRSATWIFCSVLLNSER